MKIKSESLYDLVNVEGLKPGTKLNVYLDDVFKTQITFDGYGFKWENGTFDSGLFFNPLVEFEIIEEDKKIEKLDIFIFGNELDQEIGRNRIKINELIDEINRLKEK